MGTHRHVTAAGVLEKARRLWGASGSERRRGVRPGRKCPSAMGKPQLRSSYAGVDRLQQRRWAGGAAQCNLPGRLGKVPRDFVEDPAMERCSLRPRHWAARTPQRSRTACESRAGRLPHLVRGRRVRALPDSRGGGNRPQPSSSGTRIRVGPFGVARSKRMASSTWNVNCLSDRRGSHAEGGSYGPALVGRAEDARQGPAWKGRTAVGEAVKGSCIVLPLLQSAMGSYGAAN